jgi:hypothetical protein
MLFIGDPPWMPCQNCSFKAFNCNTVSFKNFINNCGITSKKLLHSDDDDDKEHGVSMMSHLDSINQDTNLDLNNDFEIPGTLY